MSDLNKPRIGAIVLAAGESRRLGTPKQLVKFQGQSLVRRAADAALQSGCVPVIVVTGANSKNVAEEFEGLNVSPAFHAGWNLGMGSSLRFGIAKLIEADNQLDAAVILVCDQPHLSAEVIELLTVGWQKAGKPMAACEYGDSIGPPCCFARSIFPLLAAIRDTEGAKKILLAHREQATAIPWPQGEIDLDTPDDLRALDADNSSQN